MSGFFFTAKLEFKFEISTSRKIIKEINSFQTPDFVCCDNQNPQLSWSRDVLSFGQVRFRQNLRQRQQIRRIEHLRVNLNIGAIINHSVNRKHSSQHSHLRQHSRQDQRSRQRQS